MLTAIGVAILLITLQQPSRDAAIGKTAAGTASVSGVVVTDDAERTPVRRARVTLNDGERRTGITVVTDDAGQFTIRNVPAGRYVITSSKSAWVGRAYGAARPGRPGTPVAIAEGQQLDKLVLQLARGAVITGTITDEYGRPMAGSTVSAFRYVFQNGTRTLIPAGANAQSDDRGIYRLYGLAPGQYVVGSSVRGGIGPAVMPGGDFRQTTDADIARALSEGRPAETRPRDPTTEDRRPTVTYAPMFYPGTPISSQAATITVAAGEERTGIDFPVGLVPTARVEGIVVDPEGSVAANTSVSLISTEQRIPGFAFEGFRSGRTNAEGRFTFAGLTPGQYMVMVRAATKAEAAQPPAAAPPGRMPEMTTPSLWAMSEVALDGHNVTGLTLTLQEGFAVSGRLHFDGSLQRPDVTRIRVSLVPVAGAGQVNIGVSPAPVTADGSFTVKGVAPGAYRVSAPIPGARPDLPGWVLNSAIAGGRDVLDTPLTVGQNIGEMVLTYTDRAAELSGVLQDASSRPAPGYFIIVFAADRTFWTPQSRRIRAIRPGADGRFIVRNLPAGDYLIAAVADIEDGEWYDPTVLQQLAGASMKLGIGEGEKKIQDIQVGGR